MVSRELVIRALSHQPVDRAPREVRVDRLTRSRLADDVAELAARFPNDIERADVPDPAAASGGDKPDPDGPTTDAWGCAWQWVGDNGTVRRPELVESPLADMRNLNKYRPPIETLDKLRLNKVNRRCEQTSRFVLGAVRTGPIARVLALRGHQAARRDLAAGSKGIRSLLSMVHEYTSREVELWSESNVDGIVVREDFGHVAALLDDRGLWRELFRPLYRDYCRALRAQDKFVILRATGDLSPVLTDLVRAGVDAVECSLADANLSRLAKRYRGRVSFFCGLDQPELLVGGAAEDVRESVTRVRRAFDFGSGGIIASCRWLPDARIDRLVAFCEQWLVPMPLHA